MIVRKISRLAAAALSLIFAANGITASASGSTGPPEKDTCTISVPFMVTDKKGWIPEGTIFTVEMTAVDGAPLPDKTFYEIDVSGAYEFGPIEFDEPDDYEYTISELVFDDDKIVFDETVYHVHIVAMYNDDGELVGGFSLTKDGIDVKPEMVDFCNDYVSRPDGSNSVTDSSEPDDQDDSSSGDGGGLFTPDTGTAIGIGTIGFAIPVLMLFAAGRRRRSSDDDPQEEGSG